MGSVPLDGPSALCLEDGTHVIFEGLLSEKMSLSIAFARFDTECPLASAKAAAVLSPWYDGARVPIRIAQAAAINSAKKISMGGWMFATAIPSLVPSSITIATVLGVASPHALPG